MKIVSNKIQIFKTSALFSALGVLFFLCGCVPATTDKHVLKPNRSIKTVYVQVAALNLRECPSVKCEILSVLQAGDAVAMLQEQQGWYEIVTSGNGTTGWLASRYVAATPPRKHLKTGPRLKKEAPVMPVEEFDVNTGGSAPPTVEESFAPITGSPRPPAQIDAPPVEEAFAQ